MCASQLYCNVSCGQLSSKVTQRVLTFTLKTDSALFLQHDPKFYNYKAIKTIHEPEVIIKYFFFLLSTDQLLSLVHFNILSSFIVNIFSQKFTGTRCTVPYSFSITGNTNSNNSIIIIAADHHVLDIDLRQKKYICPLSVEDHSR